jgi:1-pyrroline-5-carboxylate dehydrogenase
VGNLYINRKCTGALVGVEPFGGFNMSGTNAKAGGRDYLPLFMEAKVISERV